MTEKSRAEDTGKMGDTEVREGKLRIEELSNTEGTEDEEGGAQV
jgi:hypothetical protein